VNITLLAAQDLSLTTLVPRLFLSMAVVIGVMWLAARVMKNRQLTGGGIIRKPASHRPAPVVEIVAKQGVSKTGSITVVRVGGKELVLGVTDSNISLLTEIDTVDLGFAQTTSALDDQGHMQLEIQGTGTPRNEASASSSSTRKGLLEQVRELTVRK
jgi:flagellar biogenesis protein FliO